MNKKFYMGFYFKCPKIEGVAPFQEGFVRIFDEGGAESINDAHIYIPNRECSDCYNFSEDTNTGLIGFENDNGLPEDVEKASETLDRVYSGNAELRYGVVVYVT